MRHISHKHHNAHITLNTPQNILFANSHQTRVTPHTVRTSSHNTHAKLHGRAHTHIAFFWLRITIPLFVTKQQTRLTHTYTHVWYTSDMKGAHRAQTRTLYTTTQVHTWIFNAIPVHLNPKHKPNPRGQQSAFPRKGESGEILGGLWISWELHRSSRVAFSWFPTSVAVVW